MSRNKLSSLSTMADAPHLLVHPALATQLGQMAATLGGRQKQYQLIQVAL